MGRGLRAQGRVLTWGKVHIRGSALYLRKYDMCLFLCGTHRPLLFLLISAYFSSLKNICKKHFDITCFLLLFRNKNESVFVLQNQQSGTFIKFNKNNNDNYRPLLMLLMIIFCLKWCSQLCKC